MIQALAHTQAVGVQTNAAFLGRLMRDEAFATADLDTGLIERRRATLLPEPQPAGADVLALASAAVLVRQGLAQPQGEAGKTADPWDARDGWRLGGRYRQTLCWVDNGERRDIEITREGGQWRIGAAPAAGQAFSWHAQPSANPQLSYGLRITLDGRESAGTVVLHAGKAYVFHDGATHILDLYDALAHAQDDAEGHGGGLTAPMPGKIISIAVAVGDKVEGPGAAGDGSHENGAHHHGAGRRRSRRPVLCRGRPGRRRRRADRSEVNDAGRGPASGQPCSGVTWPT